MGDVPRHYDFWALSTTFDIVVQPSVNTLGISVMAMTLSGTRAFSATSGVASRKQDNADKPRPATMAGRRLAARQTGSLRGVSAHYWKLESYDPM